MERREKRRQVNGEGDKGHNVDRRVRWTELREECTRARSPVEQCRNVQSLNHEAQLKQDYWPLVLFMDRRRRGCRSRSTTAGAIADSVNRCSPWRESMRARPVLHRVHVQLASIPVLSVQWTLAHCHRQCPPGRLNGMTAYLAVDAPFLAAALAAFAAGQSAYVIGPGPSYSTNRSQVGAITG